MTLAGERRVGALFRTYQELECIRAYDSAKASGDEVLYFEEAVKEIEIAVMSIDDDLLPQRPSAP